MILLFQNLKLDLYYYACKDKTTDERIPIKSFLLANSPVKQIDYLSFYLIKLKDLTGSFD